MRWLDLLFAHWPVPIEALRPLIPDSLELDTFGGEAWLGIVPFRMADVAPRFLPSPPGPGAFPELNVRTYVRRGERRESTTMRNRTSSANSTKAANRWLYSASVVATK